MAELHRQASATPDQIKPTSALHCTDAQRHPFSSVAEGDCSSACSQSDCYEKKSNSISSISTSGPHVCLISERKTVTGGW